MAHHAKHSWGDQYADAGVWAPSTSTANFCEEDYATTIYIGEFINTISNSAYVYFALRHTARRPLTNADQLSASLFAVGVTSALYHATLRQTIQFSDDISMLFLAGSILQWLYAAHHGALTAAIYGAVGVMSALYVRSGDVLVHLAMFASMLALIGARSGWLIYQTGDEGTRRGYVRRFAWVCGYLALGFVLWNVDLEWCLGLRGLRSRVGLPWAWGLELHGWWHVLTALGAARHMELVRELCP